MGCAGTRVASVLFITYYQDCFEQIWANSRLKGDLTSMLLAEHLLTQLAFTLMPLVKSKHGKQMTLVPNQYREKRTTTSVSEPCSEEQDQPFETSTAYFPFGKEVFENEVDITEDVISEEDIKAIALDFGNISVPYTKDQLRSKFLYKVGFFKNDKDEDPLNENQIRQVMAKFVFLRVDAVDNAIGTHIATPVKPEKVTSNLANKVNDKSNITEGQSATEPSTRLNQSSELYITPPLAKKVDNAHVHHPPELHLTPLPPTMFGQKTFQPMKQPLHEVLVRKELPYKDIFDECLLEIVNVEDRPPMQYMIKTTESFAEKRRRLDETDLFLKKTLLRR